MLSSIDTYAAFVYARCREVCICLFGKISSIMRIEGNTNEIQEKSQRLWLVRHGSTLWNEQRRFCGHSDVPLTPEGRAQAAWLATCLSKVKIAAIYTSDLLRARETAAIIAESRTQAPPIQGEAAWREIDFGAWEGLTYAEIAAQFPDQLGFFSNPVGSSPPGGESLEQLSQRSLEALVRVLEVDNVSAKGDIVIVSHGGPLRVLLSSVLGMPLERQWQLALEPGSLSALDLLPMQNQALPLGTLALLNMHRSLASLLSPQDTDTSKKGVQ
jgi:alpha-ribazole phosphatase